MKTEQDLKNKIDSWLLITPTWGNLMEEILQKMRVYNINYEVMKDSPNTIHYNSVELGFTGVIELT